MTAAFVPAHAYEVVPGGPVDARVRAPASKSMTNRLLIVAALADGVSTLRDPLVSDDSRVMLEAIRDLGADVEERSSAWIVSGTAGAPRSPCHPLHAGLSGTTMRFLPGVAALTDRGATVTGDPPLLRRPVGELVDALGQLGAGIQANGAYPPVCVDGGGLAGGAVTIDVTRSSQFASGVLLVSPYARHDVRLHLLGRSAADYIAMTAQVMNSYGAEVEQTGDGYRVAAGVGYAARDVAVEYDASAACHLFSIAMATGGRVTVTNAAEHTFQPDAGLLDVLVGMGGRVQREGDAVTVTGPEALEPVVADLSATPDQVTTVAALAALADGASELTGVAVARAHETDRLAALATELSKLGIGVTQSEGGLRITGGGARGPADLHTYDDHRLAMAFAAVGTRVPGLRIGDPSCVTKTYPEFWHDLAAMGVTWRELGPGEEDRR